MGDRGKCGLSFAAWAFLIAVYLSASANAATLRGGSGGTGAAVAAGGPGQVSWTWYETTEALSGNPDSASVGHAANGDNLLKLENPNGSANTNLAGGGSASACAMIYVFDDDQEMGACCGCPVSSAGIETFSVINNLTSSWGITGGEGADKQSGAIAIVASAPNNFTAASPNNGKFCTFGSSQACNFGCDPTNVPGYSAPSTTRNLLGSIIHNDRVTTGTSTSATTSRLTELALFNDAGGDPTNLAYLQAQCGAMVGNGSGGGICACPGKCVTPPAGLIAWWPGDDNANDIVGGNNGTINGGVMFSPGEVADAFNFDGSGTESVVPAPFTPSPHATVDAWLNPSIIQFSTAAGAKNGCRDLSIGIRKNQIGADYAPISGMCTNALLSGIPAQVNTWYHVAVTIDGTTARLYVNGVLTASALTLPNYVPDTGFAIGTDTCCNASFGGLVDEVEVFNRTLSDSEIQAIYNAGSAGKCKG